MYDFVEILVLLLTSFDKRMHHAYSMRLGYFDRGLVKMGLRQRNKPNRYANYSLFEPVRV